MRQRQSTLTSSQVQSLFQFWILPVLGPWPVARRCTASVVATVLAFAAHRLSSVADAVPPLMTAPDGDTILLHLAKQFADPAVLDPRIRHALTDHLPRAIRRGCWPVAC